MLEIVREVHGRHPTAPELALDRVVVRKGGFQAAELLSHTTARGAVVELIIRPGLPRGQGCAAVTTLNCPSRIRTWFT